MSTTGAAARLIAVLCLASLLSPIMVSAQHSGHGATIEEASSTIIVGDAAQDVFLSAGTRGPLPAQNTSTTPAGSNFDHLDILKFGFLEETEGDFKVLLHTKALQPPAGTPGFPFRFVSFSYGQLIWRVVLGPCERSANSAGAVAGCLGFSDGGRDFRGQLTVPAVVQDGAFVFTIPKAALFNENRVPARYGDYLTNLSAYATQWIAGLPWFPGDADPVGGVQALDQAPANGISDLQFVFLRGSNGRGHFALSSDQPIRVSNGEATTIVYQVDLFNHAVDKLTAQMEVLDIREGWTARVPSLIELPPQSSIRIPVIVALPFTHDHGKTATFKVSAKAVEDPNSFATLDLGIFWTDVPQPSAHHNGELWFHSAPDSDDDGNFIPETPLDSLGPRQGWMNSIEDDPDPDATDLNVPGFSDGGMGCAFTPGGPTTCPVPPQVHTYWGFPLSPGLLIGLDFDITKQAKLLVDVMPKVPATSATMHARLLYCDPATQSLGGDGRGFGGARNSTCSNYNVLLAQGSLTNAFTPNTAAHFEILMGVEPIADLLAQKTGANFMLRLDLVTDTPQSVFTTAPPEFVTKAGRLYLPLVEYHDPIDEAFQNIGALELTPLSGFEKKVNPGETVLFGFNLTNKAKTDQRIHIDVQGINNEWARLTTPADFPMRAGATAGIQIAITPPADAEDQERAEIFLAAGSPDDQTVVTVSRLRATVVTGEDIPDEAAALVVVKEDSPGFGAVLLVAGLVGIAVWRRRQP